MIELELLQEADMVLNACGRPQPPAGFRFVDLWKVIPFHFSRGAVGITLVTNESGDLVITFYNALGICNVVDIINGSLANALSITVNPVTQVLTIVLAGLPGVGTSTGFQVAAAVNADPNCQAIGVTAIADPTFGGDVCPVGNLTLNTPTSAGAILSPTQQRIENVGNTVFLVQGLTVGSTTNLGFQVKWPNGRFLNQNLFQQQNIPYGQAAGMLSFDEWIPIEPGGKIGISVAGGTGVVDLQFWGKLRYLLKDKGSNAAGAVSSADGAGCVVGYQKGGGCIVGYPVKLQPGQAVTLANQRIELISDPVEILKLLPRFRCSQNQNIMAPETRLGNQCTPEIPAGYDGETFSFFSNPIACPVGGQSFGNIAIVPGTDRVVLKRVRVLSEMPEDGGTASPVFGLRLPSGYSLTGGDLVPAAFLDWWPVFPTMTVNAGDRLVIDLADVNAQGGGDITSTLEFEGIKLFRKTS